MENVLRSTITIGPDTASQRKKEKKRKRKEGLIEKDEETPQQWIPKQSCALLNSGGGVLIMEIADFQSPSCEEVNASKNAPHWLDEFWKTIEPKLKALAKPATYDQVFDRRVEDDKILLFISAPNHLCTMDYNLYFPGDAGVEEASYQQTVNLLQKQRKGWRRKSCVDVSLQKLPQVPKEFTYKETLGFHECKQVQLKQFESETILDSRNHAQRVSICKQISAFANARGGVILLGVANDGQVHGVNIERNRPEDIEERVDSIFNNMCFPFPLERKVHYDVTFVPVLGCDSSAVVVIKVAGMESSGGVFTKCPKSFELLQDEIEPIEFDEWKRKMLSGVDLQTNDEGLHLLSVLIKFKNSYHDKYLKIWKDRSLLIRLQPKACV